MLALFQTRRETPRMATLRGLALFATLSPRELRVVDSLLHERQRLLLTRIQQNQSDSLILCEPVIYEIERA